MRGRITTKRSREDAIGKNWCTMNMVKRSIKKIINKIFVLYMRIFNCRCEDHVVIARPFYGKNITIGKFSYIAPNAKISYTDIGKFCSIGPNFLCGWGIHPVEAVSTSPIFYSKKNPFGEKNLVNNCFEERKKIVIGNDVFIGANVTVLDGIKIGDGAVIGAGAVVSKDIPPYAVAFGNPIEIRRYRFPKDSIDKLLKIKWWNLPEEKMEEMKDCFFEVDAFIEKMDRFEK